MNNPSPTYTSMDRRQFLIGVGSAAMVATTGLISHGQAPDAPEKRPRNFVIILTDQQHFDTISGGGCPYLSTPALDGLRANGTSFEKAYCTNPVCSPSRSSMLTGRASTETGVCTNGLPIRSDIPNLGQWLSTKAGFETVYAGKWHLPEAGAIDIPGFDVISTCRNLLGNVSDPCTARACEGYLMNRNGDKPFLMIASFTQPHDIHGWVNHNWIETDKPMYPELDSELPPLPDNFDVNMKEPEIMNKVRKTDPNGGPGSWSERHWRYYRWSYYRQVEMIDAEIGRILDAIKEAGIEDETMVIFMSDHGEGLAHHRLVFKNCLYDEACRVPLIVSWAAGGIPRGIVHGEHPVSGYDLFPTICDYAGIDLPRGVVGKSLRPLFEGKGGDFREGIVSELVMNRARLVRTKRYKYIVCPDDPVEQFFDMEADPGETVNLAGNPDLQDAIARHRTFLVEWESALDPSSEAPYLEEWKAKIASWKT